MYGRKKKNLPATPLFFFFFFTVIQNFLSILELTPGYVIALFLCLVFFFRQDAPNLYPFIVSSSSGARRVSFPLLAYLGEPSPLFLSLDIYRRNILPLFGEFVFVVFERKAEQFIF